MTSNVFPFQPSVFQKIFMDSASFAYDYLAESKLENKVFNNNIFFLYHSSVFLKKISNTHGFAWLL